MDLGELEAVIPVRRTFYDGPPPYHPYAAGDGLVPAFLPVGNPRHQVRLTASTHNVRGILQYPDAETLANTRRLPEKIEAGTPALYELDERDGAETLLLAYGISSLAAREAAAVLRAQGTPVSLLVAHTLLPIPPAYYEILERYSRIVAAEENVQAQLTRLLFGQQLPEKVRTVTGLGEMISPDLIVEKIKNS
jgi:2-oxoglutarate ferredoxin oxidoreductase subunit alpha